MQVGIDRGMQLISPALRTFADLAESCNVTASLHDCEAVTRKPPHVNKKPDKEEGEVSAKSCQESCAPHFNKSQQRGAAAGGEARKARGSRGSSGRTPGGGSRHVASPGFRPRRARYAAKCDFGHYYHPRYNGRRRSPDWDGNRRSGDRRRSYRSARSPSPSRSRSRTREWTDDIYRGRSRNCSRSRAGAGGWETGKRSRVARSVSPSHSPSRKGCKDRQNAEKNRACVTTRSRSPAKSGMQRSVKNLSQTACSTSPSRRSSRTGAEERGQSPAHSMSRSRSRSSGRSSFGSFGNHNRDAKKGSPSKAGSGVEVANFLAPHFMA